VNPRNPIVQYLIFQILMLAPLWLIGC